MTPRAAPVDIAAVSLSSLCLIHCLALPLASAVMPVAGVLADAEWVHKALVLFAWPVSGLAVMRSLRTKAGWMFAVPALCGLAILSAAAFLEALHDHETALTVTGAAVLASAHMARWLRGGAEHI